MTQGIAARLSARLLEEFGSPDEIFRAPLPHLERCNLPAAVAQAVHKKQAFRRAEKELASIRGIENLHLVNWTDPEYPKTLREIYDPPTLLYVRGNVEVLISVLHRRGGHPEANLIWHADGGAPWP